MAAMVFKNEVTATGPPDDLGLDLTTIEAAGSTMAQGHPPGPAAPTSGPIPNEFAHHEHTLGQGPTGRALCRSRVHPGSHRHGAPEFSHP